MTQPMPDPQYVPQYVYQQPVPQKKSKTWLWITLSVVVVMLLGCLGACTLFVGGAAKVSNDIQNGQVQANNDVKLVDCTYASNAPAANLRITNSGKDQASYMVDVTFTGANGDQVDSAMAAVNDLAPGQSANAQAVALTLDNEKYKTCKISDVTRL